MDTIETNSVKSEKFDGQSFRRWQKQIRYWLTVLGLVSALEDTTSETPSKKTILTISTPTSETQSSKSTTPKMTKDEIEYHCHNRILSALSNDLYDVYRDTTSAKSLWEELEVEYGLDDAGIDRFTMSTFNSYKMVEEKTVSVQIHEFKDLLRKAESKGTKFTEEFKVSCLIDKLPPSWSNFAKSLRHKQGELTLTKVFNKLRVEEKHRLEEQIEEGKSKVNLMENSNNRNRFQRRKNSFKRTNINNSFHQNQNSFRRDFNHRFHSHPNRSHNNSNDKREQACFVCGRTNHLARDCHFKKTEVYKPKPKWNKGQNGPKAQVNMLVDQDDHIMRTQVEEV